MLNTSLQIVFTEITGGDEADLGWSWISSWRSSSTGAIWEYIALPGMKRWTGGCEEKTQRQVWGTGSKTCLYTVLGGRSSLCLHLGAMGDQLPAESVERKRAHVPRQAPSIPTHWRGWLKEKHPFLLLASNCNRVPQKKRSRGEQTCRPSPAGPHP